jgi:hypothetical protein
MDVGFEVLTVVVMKSTAEGRSVINMFSVYQSQAASKHVLHVRQEHSAHDNCAPEKQRALIESVGRDPHTTIIQLYSNNSNNYNNVTCS